MRFASFVRGRLGSPERRWLVRGHLNEEIFDTLDDARPKIARWRHDGNAVRSHSPIGNLTPLEAAPNARATRGRRTRRACHETICRLPIPNRQTLVITGGPTGSRSLRRKYFSMNREEERSLFRHESIEAKTGSWAGTSSLPKNISLRMTAWISVAVLGALIAFLSFAQYTRRVPALGVLTRVVFHNSCAFWPIKTPSTRAATPFITKADAPKAQHDRHEEPSLRQSCTAHKRPLLQKAQLRSSAVTP